MRSYSLSVILEDSDFKGGGLLKHRDRLPWYMGTHSLSNGDRITLSTADHATFDVAKLTITDSDGLAYTGILTTKEHDDQLDDLFLADTMTTIHVEPADQTGQPLQLTGYITGGG